MAEAGPSGAREPEEGDDSSEEDDNVSVFEMSSEAESPRRPVGRPSTGRNTTATFAKLSQKFLML